MAGILFERHDEDEHHGADSGTTSPTTHAHHSNHTINIKFGNILLLISLLYIIFNYIYIKIFKRDNAVNFIKVKYSKWIKFISLIIVVLACEIWPLSTFNLSETNLKMYSKRLGRLSYSLVPLDIFLSIKPGPFGLENYLDVLQLHKLISRLLLVLALGHVFGYVAIWGIAGTWDKLLQGYVLYGIVAGVFSLILLVINWKKFRSFNYNVFYIVHQITVFSFLILLNFHAKPNVVFVSLIANILYIYQVVNRLRFNNRSIEIDQIISNKKSNLKLVRISRNKLINSVKNNEEISVGSHLRISYPMFNLKYWLYPSHPFSTYMESNNSPYVDLILKTNKFVLDKQSNYSVELFNKSSLGLSNESKFKNIVIITGGTGISFGGSIYQYYKMMNNGFNVKLVWIVSNIHDLFILKELRLEGIEVYVTRNHTSARSTGTNLGGEETEDLIDNIELEDFAESQDEQQHVLSGSADNYDNHNNTEIDANIDKEKQLNSEFSANTITRSGYRPNVKDLIDNMIDLDLKSDYLVISCGPNSMNADIEKICMVEGLNYFIEYYSM